MTARLRRPRGQRGFTLIELLLVVGISAAILVPVFAWAALAVRTQPVTRDGLVRVADTGLLGAYLPEDVATAGAGATPGSATVDGDVEVSLDDCIGGAGEVTGEVVLALLSGGGPVGKIVYTEAPSSADSSRMSVWRRTCSAETGEDLEETEVFEGVRAGSTSATCADPVGSTACPQVRLTTWPLSGRRPLELNATRRADSASLRFDATGNRLPVAKISLVSQTAGQPFSVELSASASNDPDGEIVGYRWVIPTQPDGSPGGTAPVVVEGGPELAEQIQTPQFPTHGTYSVTLTVTDDRGARSTTYKRITAAPRAPTAVAVVAPQEVVAGQVATFTGSGSTDVDGVIVGYQWVLGDEESSAGVRYVVGQADWTFAFPEYVLGRIPVTFTVTDDQGQTDTVVTSVNVVAPGPPTDPDPDPDPETPPVTVPGGPVASFTWSAGAGADEPVDFDAGDSTDDGAIAQYAWDFGVAGATGAGATASYRYPGPGSYRVTLTVTDDAGLSGSVSQSVVVPGAPPTPPAPTQSGSTLVWAPVAGVRRYLVDFEFFANGCARTLAGQAVPVGPAPSRAIPPNLCPGAATARARYAVDVNGQVVYSPWTDITTPTAPTTSGPGQVVK